jgi:quercetin dioxygenase-like cupin family protein
MFGRKPARGFTPNERNPKMKFTALLLSLSLLSSLSALAVQAMAAEPNKKSQMIYRAGTQASVKGPAEYFTGNVRVDPLFPANETASFSGAYVTFEPGARSAWHIHPKGQHLLVTAGVGRTGEWEGKVDEIKAGDVIWCPPGVKHWHGASPTTAMTHIALTGTLNGKNVEWMEKVTDEQYNGK